MSLHPELVADGYDVTCRGRTYHVGLITQAVKSKFEKQVFAKERQKLADVRDLLTPERWQEKADALSERYLAGGFSVVQEDMSQSPLKNPENAFTMLAVMMGVDEVEVISLVSESGVRDELMRLFHLALRDSFPGLGGGEGGQKKT